MPIQSYNIEERIGHGGMGVVYKASHPYRKEIVAIKSLGHQFCIDPQLRERFKNEAHILSVLDHKNIVKVLDFIEEKDSLHIVMEYVEGKTLDKIIGQEVGPIPYEKAIPIFTQILEGIEYAHANGVVHRDIKPSNIIVKANGEVKIMDFGIAKIANNGAFTKTGTKMGTLYYMSPEQIRGEHVDERSDIYSLGMTLYEMLAGRLPFKKSNDVSEFTIMNQIVNEPLPDPRDFYPSIPEWLVDVVMSATKKDKSKRLSSISEFLKLLKNEQKEEEKEIIISKMNNQELNKKDIITIGLIISIFSLFLIILIIFTQKITPSIPDLDFEKEILTLKGHTGQIYAVTFSPDGNFLASCGQDKSIKIWNVKSGALIETLLGHKYWVFSVSFSPNGKYLASGSGDGSIKIWNVESGELIKTIKSDWVNSVNFSPNGKYLASGGSDKSIKIWNVKSGKLIKSLIGHNDWINSVNFSLDGKYLASGSSDESIKIWNVESGELIKTLIGHEYGIKSVNFSPDGIYLVSRGSTIKVWNIEFGNLIKTLDEKNLGVFANFSPNGKYIVSGDQEEEIKIWNVESGEINKTLIGHKGMVWSVHFSPDGKYLASGSLDSTIKIWETNF